MRSEISQRQTGAIRESDGDCRALRDERGNHRMHAHAFDTGSIGHRLCVVKATAKLRAELDRVFAHNRWLVKRNLG